MARLPVANPFLAICSLAVALLPVACGPDGAGSSAPSVVGAHAPRQGIAPLDPLPGASATRGAHAAPLDPRERILVGLRLLVRARGELEVVRRFLADGATESAGASLNRTIRDLEEGMAVAGARLTPSAAADFEVARRSADRWSAGEAPSGGTAERIVRSLEDESDTLARALGPR
jgi:hypothetical protein